jgi:response regulator RpfG family c-di-GMP phosphodiesterase
VRHDPQTQHIPIIMITAIHEYSDFRFSAEDGEFLPVDEFVEKPIRKEVLLAKVKLLLSGSAGDRNNRSSDQGIGWKKN